MVEFALVYSLMKVMRTMLAGTVVMSAALAVCRAGGHRTQCLNLGMLFLVPLACLMSYSKIFYTGWIAYVNLLMNRILTWQMAAAYFGVAGILAARAVYVQHRLGCEMKHMEQMGQEDCPACLAKGRGLKIRYYLSEDGIGPFSGGLFRPYVVVPKMLKQVLTKDEFEAVLYHELLHIRLGHVLVLHIYAWLKIIWWIHPLIYFCDSRLRENIEYSSDEGSVALSPLDVYGYGRLMLKVLRMQGSQGIIGEGVSAFFGNGFQNIEKRIQRLANIGQGRIFVKKMRRLCASAVMAMTIGVFIVIATSYPRYTKIKEISVFDEKMNILTYDMEAEGIHADTADGGFRIGEKDFARLISKYHVTGDYVVFSYDTIMKVPGVGGGGQSAMVSLADPSDVFLMGSDKWIDKVHIFIMKYFM